MNICLLHNRLLTAALLTLASLPGQKTYAQHNQIFNERIATLQVVGDDNWQSMPIVELGGQAMNISFDDLTHEYHRYTYRIEHLDAYWQPTEQLFSSDFIDGFTEGNTIDPVDESYGTNTLYTHYRLSLPNEHCSIKKSGNYRLTVYDDNESDEPVLSACFMVVEKQMAVSMTVTSNTDVDFNKSHQQVEAAIDYGGLRVTDPERQVKTVVLQNGRWDDARRDIQPQYRMADGLKWSHCHDYIFHGGNEYRKFETLDVSHTTMGLEAVNWDGKDYHAWTWTDSPRPSYVYDESGMGSYYIRNSDNQDNDISTEYLWVHFRLEAPRQTGDVYVNADWTDDEFSDKYRMVYNETEHIYELALRLKQGYYSYQYLTLYSDGTAHPVSSEGDFFQTKNRYQMLVYYRGNGELYDRLVGYQQVQVK